MSDLVRMSFSIEKPLFDRLEKLIEDHRYSNRSEFVRDLIREQLVSQEWEADTETLGTVTLIYDHHIRQLGDRLTNFQHEHHKEVLASTHIHLDKHLCAEVIMLKGRASAIKHISDHLRQQKGVLHSALSMSSVGKRLS